MLNSSASSGAAGVFLMHSCTEGVVLEGTGSVDAPTPVAVVQSLGSCEIVIVHIQGDQCLASMCLYLQHSHFYFVLAFLTLLSPCWCIKKMLCSSFLFSLREQFKISTWCSVKMEDLFFYAIFLVGVSQR